MTGSQSHDFHFVMDRTMKNKLVDLKLFKKIGNLSKLIRKILSLITPLIKNEHTWGEQRKSSYLPVSNDPKEVREHIHVYLSEVVYRELKLLHQDLNCYSIAQLMRGFLGLFLDLIEEHGETEVYKMLNEMTIEIEEEKLTAREAVRQLWRIIRHLPSQSGLITIYCDDFSPFWIFRL